MESGEYKMVHIKRENDIHDEVFDRSGVKYEPCQSGMYEGSKRDNINQKNTYYKYEEHKEEYVAVEVKTEDVDFTDASTIHCKAEQVTSEFDCDIHYGDVKVNFVENMPGKPERGKIAFLCKICSKTFTTLSHLKIHERIHTGDKPFHCQVCSKAFTSSSKFKRHERIHTGDKPFHCKICSKAFTTSGNLKIHGRTHTGVYVNIPRQMDAETANFVENMPGKPERGKIAFLCKICSKTFTTSSHLKVHERIHTGEKPFHCKICSKAFTQSGSLKIHERVHSGEKSFHCKTCSKTFSRSDNLKVHERIHTGENLFHCKFCSKTVTTSSHLKIHERMHTGDKPFQCQVCSKAFTSSSKFKRHERIHTGDKPFQCQVCSKAFTTSGNLKIHGRTHTGVYVNIPRQMDAETARFE